MEKNDFFTVIYTNIKNKEKIQMQLYNTYQLLLDCNYNLNDEMKSFRLGNLRVCEK